jgi:transcriptional regulator with XRE-family HTH domain
MVGRERSQGEQVALRAWGDVIRRYRRWAGISRRELAARAGLSPVFLGEIERGEKDLSTRSLSLLADALDVSLSELYFRVGTGLQYAARETRTDQASLPLGLKAGVNEDLEGVPPANDETAYDLYRIARLLPSEQQVSLLVLAQSFAALRRREGA